MADSKTKQPRIVIVGGGLGGILTAVAIRKQLKYYNFVIYEKGPAPGGVWRETTYPGCGCDVPSHWYSLSSELNPNWSTHYACQPEIRAYWEQIYRKHALASHTIVNTAVIIAKWDSKAQLHHITLRNSITGEETQTEAEIVIWAIGRFMSPRYPTDVGDMQDFKGPSWHLANWRKDVDLRGKRVGVIGNGCSASQVIPQISENPSVKIVNFCRSPQWYTKRVQFEYSPLVKWIFAHVPLIMRMYRNFLMFSGDSKSMLYWKNNSRVLADFRKELVEYMKSVAPEKYLKKLIPEYAPGCRRIILDSSYLDSLNRPNVSLNWDGIDRIVENGIKMKTGETIPLDVIIYGTGFAPLMEYMQAVGNRGTSVEEYYEKNGPTAYLGTLMPGFPNLFRLYGPNTSTGAHASVIFVQEVQAQYILQLIKPIIEGKAKSFEVTDEATDEYNAWIQKRVENTVWVDCESWYRRDKTGKNVAIFPGSVTLFWWKLRKPRWDHLICVGAEKWAKERRQGALMKLIMASLLLVASVATLFNFNMLAVSV